MPKQTPNPYPAPYGSADPYKPKVNPNAKGVIPQKSAMDALLDLITQMTPAYNPNNPDAVAMAKKRADATARMQKGQAEMSGPRQSVIQQMFGVTAPEWLQGILDVLKESPSTTRTPVAPRGTGYKPGK